ncbi:MAG: hypothetical protein KJO31_02220 [Gammaproteobacteria bacterium]|nr:hypothetical protein [Gammaproteobacteria bacterium]
MSDEFNRGFTVSEIAPFERAIEFTHETTAAFVGRALRGPLNTPVLVENFAAFTRRFGSIWRRSALGPAVEQFFEHGGRKLYVVRVANNARGAMVCLPANGDALVLRALEPGSTENIRAAVDYDGIADGDEERFNLVIQRVAPDTSLVADQEIYLRLSCREGARNFVADVLLDSSLIRVQEPLPNCRPTRTSRFGTRFEASYAGHAQRGSDGQALSDYDLVGSAVRGTGLFALDQVERFDLLYLPPPARGVDLGPAATLAAELYCRKRGAMLVMDPPENWHTPVDALKGVRDAGFSSPNMLSYFPRMNLRDDAQTSPRCIGGAIAGLVCKLDRQYGAWEDLNQSGLSINRKYRPASEVSPEEAQALVRAGLNVVAESAAGRAKVCGSVTMGSGSQMDRRYSRLRVRRLCLTITRAIERATRWAVFEQDEEAIAERLLGQVDGYMSQLAQAGAFEGGRFAVQCNAGFESHAADADRGVSILLTFQPAGDDEELALTLHQTVTGFRVATTAFGPVNAAVA